MNVVTIEVKAKADTEFALIFLEIPKTSLNNLPAKQWYTVLSTSFIETLFLLLLGLTHVLGEWFLTC